MPTESTPMTAGLVILSALMLILGYLFYEQGQLAITLVLLFVGIVLALTLASRFIRSEQRRRTRPAEFPGGPASL